MVVRKLRWRWKRRIDSSLIHLSVLIFEAAIATLAIGFGRSRKNLLSEQRVVFLNTRCLSPEAFRSTLTEEQTPLSHPQAHVRFRNSHTSFSAQLQHTQTLLSHINHHSRFWLTHLLKVLKFQKRQTRPLIVGFHDPFSTDPCSYPCQFSKADTQPHGNTVSGFWRKPRKRRDEERKKGTRWGVYICREGLAKAVRTARLEVERADISLPSAKLFQIFRSSHGALQLRFWWSTQTVPFP